MKTLVNSQYNPARGGHAPSDLRDAFLKTVEAVFDWSTGEPEPTVEVREGNACQCGLRSLVELPRRSALRHHGRRGP
jgi:hypothetical protein